MEYQRTLLSNYANSFFKNKFSIFIIGFFVLLIFTQRVSAQNTFIQSKGATSICAGQSTNLEVTIDAGVAPYTVVYSDGSSNFTLTSYDSNADIESPSYGGDPITVSPTSTTVYSLISVHDFYNSSLPISSETVTITVNPLPINIVPTVNGGSPVCFGTSFEINANATNGDTYELWNAANTAPIGVLPYNATITSNTNYTIRAISSFGCVSSEPLLVNLENIPPTISGEGNKTLNPVVGTCSALLLDYRSTVTVSDNCSAVGNITLTQNPVPGSSISDYNTIQPVVIAATDEAGNQNTYNFNVTLIDNIDPEITTCVGDQIDVPANSGCSYVHNESETAWNATATDNCTVASLVYNLTGATSGTGTNLNGVTFLAGTTTVTWTVKDGAGLTASCSFDVSISDSEDPTVSCVGNQTTTTDTGECTYTLTNASWDATTNDNCGTPSVSYELGGVTSGIIATTLNGVTFNKGLTNVKVTVTDGALNTATCNFTVTINDNENPTIVNLPGNISVNNDSDLCGAIVSWTEPTAADNCVGQSIAQTTGLVSGSTFPIGVSTITYTATDASGNETTESFTITVTDNQNPEITCTENISHHIEAGVCGATITYTAPIGTDNCAGSSTSQTLGLASGATFPVGVTTNTFEVTDASGNKSTCSFTVTITDTENPTIVNLPENITIDNDVDACGALVSWTEPTSDDNCSGSTIIQTSGLANGSVFPVGISTIIYTATDASSNTFEDSFTITVVDAQIPIIVACPSNITKSSDVGSCNAIVSWTEPSANDNCTSSGNIAWTKSHNSGDTFNVGITTVTYTATDEALNNSITCSFDVTVEDNEKPIISDCPTTIAQDADAGNCTAVVTWTEPTATDNCTLEENLVWAKSHNSGNAFPVGTTTVTYTATDEAGNISITCAFDVIISDNEVPNAICASPTINLNASGVATLTVNDVNNGSSDNCTLVGDLIITLSKTTFNCSNIGANTVVMTVKDASGNTNTCSSTVTVADNIAPTLTTTAGTVDSNLNVDAGVCNYTVKGSELDPIGVDNCNGITLSYTVTGVTSLSGTTSLAGKTLEKGANIITWIVSDGTNTSAPLIFTKTVVDNQAPTVSTVGNKYKGTTLGICGYTVSGTEFDATYSDNCSVASVSYTINSGTSVNSSTLDAITLATGINNIVWTVSDGTNSKSSSFRVTVADDENPTISSIADITEQITTGCSKIVTWPAPTEADNCSVASFTQTKGLASGSDFPVGTTLTTYTAIDAAGNSATMSFNVIVEDLTPPVLTCPSGSPFSFEADTGCFYTVVGTVFDATTTDGCAFTDATYSFDGGITDEGTTLAGSELPVGSHTITWTAVDEYGNESTCAIVVNITDTQVPTFDQPTGDPALGYNYDRNADPAQCYYTIPDTFFDLRNISDNCELQAPSYVISKPGMSDIAGTNTLSGVQLPSDQTNPYSIVWTVADVNSNTVIADAFTITVTDNQPPTFDCYGNETRNIPTTGCNYTIIGTEFDPVSLADNCDALDSLTITYTLDGISGGASTTLADEVLDAGVHPVVWTITDPKGNVASCNFNITVIDPVLPTISSVVNQTRNAPSTSCGYVTVGTEFDPVTVTDNCPSYTLTNNQNGSATLADYVFPVGITAVVWTVTDAGGNVVIMNYQVEILDVTAPEYILIGDASATVAITKSTSASSCYYTAVGNEFDPQSITDNCTGANFTVLNGFNNYLSLAYEQFPVGTTSISWTVTDNYGNATTKTLEITVVDDVEPVINCPASVYTRVYDQNQDYYTIGVNEFEPVVSDNCTLATYTYVLSGATSGSGTSLTNTQLSEGVNTIVWTAIDNATSPNQTTCSITVNVVSDLFPSITCVGDQSKNTSPAGACSYTVSGNEFNATSTTAGATLINNYNSASSLAGAVFPEGTTLVTWTASQTIDGTLYTNDCSFYVFVSDNEDPIITAPADVIVNTNSGCYATGVVLGTPIVTDNCGVDVGDVWNNQGDATYGIGTTTVTWWAYDIHGNISSTTQTVTVLDDDAPTFNCPGAICREVDEIVGVKQNYYTVFDHEFNPYGTWDCTGVLSVTNDLNNSSTLAGYQFPLGETVVTWTFVDSSPSNNTTTCVSTITINNDDPPSVTCRGNQTRSTDLDVCSYTSQGLEFDVTSTTSGTTLTYTLSGATVDASGTGTTLSGVSFNKGTTTVSWTATNGADTNTCCIFNVYVYDNQNPVVTWPANISVGVDTGGCTATNVILGTPTATDNCDDPAQISTTKSTSSTSFNVGVTNVFWSARDTRGNYVYHTQTVTVTDDEAPVITCPTTTYYREYTNPYVNYYYIRGDEFTPNVSDNCTVASYTNSITSTRYLNGELLTIGDYTITWTATDTNPGTPNTATCDVNVTIVDSFVPIIDCSNNITQTTDAGECSYTVPLGITTYDATFESVSGDNRTMTYELTGATTGTGTSLSEVEFNKGVTTITWTATQQIGGVTYTNDCSFTFTVVDNIPPVIDELFDDVTVNVDTGTCTKTFTLTKPTATDNCSALGDITITSNAPATFVLGTTNVRWKLTDEAGNTTIYIQKVTVYDNEAPVIANCPAASLTAEATGNNCQVVVSWPALIATDDCTGVKSFTASHAPGTLFDVGTTTVTYTATDNNNNISTCSFDVVVTDSAPTISCVANQTRSADSGTCSYKVLGNEFDPVSYTDNCEIPAISWSFIDPNTLLEVTGNYTLSGVSIPRGSGEGATGEITITWTATDFAQPTGQTASCSFVLTITDDEAPILVVPGNQTRSTDLHQNYYTVGVGVLGGEFDDVTAVDNCGIVTKIKIEGESEYTTLDGLQMQMGENLVTWIATDDSGNAGSANFYAYIVDTELPRIENAPSNISVNATSGCSAIVNYVPPTFIDNVTLQGTLNITISPAEAISGYDFPVGITEVSYIVIDEAENILTYSFDVTVTDNLDPTILCPTGDVGNQFNRNTDTDEAFYTAIGTEFNPTSFSDNCVVTIENNYNNDVTLASETFPIGTTEVIWTAIDESLNTASCTINVVVTDIEVPVINECASSTVNQTNDLGACYFTVTSSEFDPYDFNDNAGTSKLTYSIDGAAEVGTDVNTSLVGVQIPVGATQVVWKLYDAYYNVSATCTTDFTITDTENPTLVPVATQTRNLDTGLGTYTAASPVDNSWNIPISDNCDIATITYQIDGGTVIGTDETTSIIGETFTVGTHTVVWEATDIHGNSNTGFYQVIIEDNEAPTAVCNPITIDLDTTGSYLLTAGNISDISSGSSDPSGIATYEVTPNTFDCVDVGDNTVTITLTDTYGNESTCNAVVTVQDITPPTVVCKPVTALYLDAFGNASITVSDINNGSSDACGIASISASQTDFDCTEVGVNNVTLTVTDVNGNSNTCDTTVTILDDVNPVAVCKNITVALDASGNTTIVGLDIDNGSYDNCLSTLVRTATPNTFDCSDIGANEVILTVTDPAGNSDTCTAIVTIEDITPPTAIAQDITIQLDASGNAIITANDINNGSNDACGILNTSIDNSSFNCSNIGSNQITNTVTLTVTDTNNNVSTDTAVVTVQDITNPDITCTTPQTVDTNSNVCTYTHNNNTWNANAIDACGTIASLTYALSGATELIDAPDTSLNGQVFNKGVTTVTWTAKDGSGNESTCTFDVTVEDNQVPTASCQNITIQLDGTGNASIIAADIDNSSNDNCGIQSIAASKTAFTCADYGPNTVTLTVTDTSNNVSTCDATVTVQDSIDPEAVCTPITVQLNSSGTYALSGTDISTISAGSTDNCSIVTSEVSPNTFTCSDIGTPVNVTLTVTDIAGNTDTCATTITVEDNLAPNAICQNITLTLDNNGDASLTANDIDGGSNDACGILSRSASKTDFTCADIGSNIVTLTVTDTNNNVSTCDATVTIQDTAKPTFILCSANQAENTDLGVCAYTKTNTSWDATATDNCGVSSLAYNLTGATSGTGTSLNGVAFNKGVTTITWTATDASGNFEKCEYTLTVTDNEAPNAICQVATVELQRDGTVVVVPSQIDNNSTDNCAILTYEISRDGTNFGTNAIFTCADIGTNTTYLRVTDEAGLTDVCSTAVTVDDTQAPTLDDLNDRNEVVDADVCTYTHSDNLWNPIDNCDPSPTITYTLSGATTVVTAPNTTLNGQVFEKGTTTVTWSVADHSSPINSDTVTFDVIVTDDQDPTISCPASITPDVASAGDLDVIVSGISAPIYDDNCAVTKLTYELSGATTTAAQASGINELSSATFNLGTTTIDYIVYDAAGNTETCNFTITVNALPTNTIIVSPTAITTNEDLGTATFTVVLPFAPSGEVVFNVESNDLTEGTVSTSSLSFDATNWDQPQPVTVTGVNDDVDDGDIPYTIVLTTNQALTDDLSGYENVDPDDVSVTNEDNDTAGVSVSTVSNATTEAGGTATFTVVLDTEPTEDVTITLSSDDTTESDTFGPTTLAFTAANWNTPQTVTVTGKDDDIFDENVTYNIVASDASSADPKYDGLAVNDVSVVNNDNDTAGFIVTPTTLTTSEDGTTATFTIVLTSKPGTDSDQTQVVVIDVESDDTTEGTVDLSHLTFNNLNWNTPQTVTVTGVNDAIVDGTIAYNILNTINTTLTTDGNYDPLNPDNIAVNNTDNDSATLSIDSVTQDETNSGTTNFVFTVTHSGAEVVGPYSVSFYTQNGVAKAPSDYTSNGGPINFTGGSIGETQTITIAVNGDSMVESNETFNVVLNSVTAPGKNITINPAGKIGVATITNDDSATLSIADETIVEGNSGTKTLTFTVTLNRDVEDGLTINYTTNDATATTANSDYVANSETLTFTGNAGEEQTIDVTINGDEIVELDEIFNVNLSNILPVSAPGSAISFANASATGTITNDDSAIVSITGFTINESEVGTVTANFTITMDKSVQTAFTIDFATSDDTTLAGSDYAAVTKTAGTALNFGDVNPLIQTVSIPITNDTYVEPSEDLFGTISNKIDGANQSVTFFEGGASTQATATITDNDAVSIAINDISVNEAAGTATFTVTLTGDIQDNLTVDYTTVNVDALSGSDYTLASGTVTFAGGSTGTTTKPIIVTILNDVIAEPTETYTINLGNISSTGTASFTDSSGLGTITDNDTVHFELHGFTVWESNVTKTRNFYITRDIASQDPFLFYFSTSDGTAKNISDYIAHTNTDLTLPINSTNNFEIVTTIAGDLIAEPSETFSGTITINNANGQNYIIDIATVTSTINDNDTMHITLEDKTVTETDLTQNVNYVVRTNIAAEKDIIFNYTTTDGDALDGSDYTKPSYATITIPAGSTTGDISIDVLGDDITEPQETYSAAITENNYNLQQVVIDKSNATYTIDDEDPATLSITGFTVDEAAGTADYTITLSKTVQNAFTVDFATSNIIDEALAGSDYTAVATTTLNFGPGNPLVQTVAITINDDDLVEPSETLLGTISNLVANDQAVTIPTPTAISTITDNDAADVVIDDVTVTEDVASGTAVFTVTLTGHIQDALKVDFTTNDGAATNPAVQPTDYTLTSGTLLTAVTFPAGSNTGDTQSITIPIINNDITEPLNEYYTVDLSNIVSTGTATIDDTQGLGTITDDDPINAITLTGFNITETNSNVLHNFVATLDYIAQEPIIISFTTTNGTAVGSDFTSQSTVEYTIPSNTLFVNIPVEVIGDLVTEPQESFTGTIAMVEDNDQQVTIGTATAIGMINDDDNAVISIAGFTVNEVDGSAEFTITSSLEIQNEVTFIFSTSNGSALSGSDYDAITSTTLTFGGSNSNPQTVSVNITNDIIAEPTELFSGILSSLVNNNQNVSLNSGPISSAIGTINDNDTITLSIDDITLDEVDDGSTVNYVFTVTHNGRTTDGPFSVNYLTNNVEALAGVDYVANSGTINFSGTTAETQTITIVVNGDDILEPTETFTVDLSENDFGGRDITFTDDSGLGTITDNDTTTVSIAANVAAAAEPNNNGQFTVSMGLESSTDTEIGYIISGTATAANDYTTLTGTVIIPAGSTEATIDVLVVNDDILEADETVIVTLNTVSGDDDITIGTPVAATVNITDEDSAEVTITANDATASESGDNGQFTVSMSNPSDVDTVISYNVSGTATATDDYTELTETVTIPAGSTSTTINVEAVNDAILEASETVIVTLSTITSGDADVSIDTNNHEATVTISDNDTASLAISDITITEGSNAVFTVTLTGNVQGGFTIDYDTDNGSASELSDYTSKTNTLTFAGTDTEFYTVTISTNDDDYLEAVENFVLNLSGISNGLVTYDNQATATINDNDAASLTVSDVTVDEGNNVVFTVVLTGNVQGGVSIDYETANNSALEGSDYTANLGTLNFTGTIPESKTITILTSEDAISEPQETFYLNFTNITNALVTYDVQAIGIIDDDDVYTISIADNTIEETEAAQVMDFTVTMTGKAQEDVVLSFSTTPNTALASTDYITESSVLITIPAGSTSVDIPVNILGDAILEPTETFTGTIIISDANGQTISISDGVATGTITDNDSAVVTIANAENTEGSALSFDVTLTGNVQGDVVVDVLFSNVSTSDADYAEATQTITFTGGTADTQTITVSTDNDAILEIDETFTASLALGTGNVNSEVVVIDTATGTITDNDSASIAIADLSVDEAAGTASYTVTLTGSVQDSFTVNYATSNNASAIGDVDYDITSGTLTFPANSVTGATQTFTVAITDDSFVEPTETYTVTLSSITGLTTISDGTAIGTITDNDIAEVSIIATTQAGEPGFNGLFTVSLTNPASVATIVSYSVTGTATADIDYTALVGTIVIPAGATSATINVDVIDDNIVETGGETVMVTLISTNSAITVGAEDNATVTIADNDASELSIGVAATVQASEPNNDGLFTLTLSNVSSVDTEVSFTITGTAIEGVDYETIGTSIIIPANTLSITIPVVVIDDSIVELTETVIINVIGTDTAVTISTINTATVTIGDDDASEVNIAPTIMASEPSIDGLFTVSLSNPVSVATAINYSISGTATASSDYVPLTGSIIIPTGETSATIDVTVIDDSIVESGETVVVTLTATDNLVVISEMNQAVVTISDDDFAIIDINDVSVLEGDNGTTIFEFIVTLSNSSSFTNSVDYATLDGTATIAEGDYILISTSTLTFLPGETSKSIIVEVVTDNEVEIDEVLTVELSNLDTSSNEIILANAIGIGMILNDDYSPIITDVIMTGIEDNNLLFAAGDFITSFEDADRDSLYSIQIQSLPENGILYLNGIEVNIGDIILASAIKDLVFIPNSNWYGEISFEYNASDGVNNALENGQVIISIGAVNDLPIANDDFVTTEQNIPIVNGTAADNDIPSDDGGNVWSLIGENGGALYGIVSMNSEGVYTYTPNDNFFGTDSFVYTITDVDGDTSNAVVTVSLELEDDYVSSIELIKTASITGEGSVGDIITYTFTITNTGNVTLNNIIINDPLISETPIAIVELLEPNSKAIINENYSITQDDMDAGSVYNSAIVTGVDVLGNEISDTSDNGISSDGYDNPTITTLEQKPAIALVKTAVFNDENADGFAQVGETITYNFTISNLGNVALSDVIVEDPLPGVVVLGAPIVLAARGIDEISFTAKYSINQKDINLGSVINQAFVTAISPKGVVVGDSSDDEGNYGDNPTVLDITGCVIEVFNAVSPNGDGDNDVFYIRGLECYPENRVEIYNRYGSLVFERENYNNTDRAFKGISEGRLTVNKSRELPDGTYYYILSYKDFDGNVNQKAGYLQINRR